MNRLTSRAYPKTCYSRLCPWDEGGGGRLLKGVTVWWEGCGGCVCFTEWSAWGHGEKGLLLYCDGR